MEKHERILRAEYSEVDSMYRLFGNDIPQRTLAYVTTLSGCAEVARKEGYTFLISTFEPLSTVHIIYLPNGDSATIKL